MAPVINTTREALEAQREQLLHSLGLTMEEFRRRAENSELSGAEWDLRDDIESISFLLGEPVLVD